MAGENVTVTSPAPINVTVQTSGSSVVVETQTAPEVAVVTNGATPQNLFIQEEKPDMPAGGMWVQTFDNGDWTIWIEAGD